MDTIKAPNSFLKHGSGILKYYKFRLKALWAAVLLLVSGCTGNRVNIDYFGQSSPGKTAALFAPGIISTDSMEHSAPVFSPDGSVVLWTVVPKGFAKPAYFLEMTNEMGKWSPPHRPSFSDSSADDYYPSFSPDGKTLFFSSRRKVPDSYSQRGDMRIWQVERKSSVWQTPVPFDTVTSKGHEFAHSVSANGTLVFSSGFFSEALNGKTGWSIYRSENINGRYSEPIRLPYNINSMGYEDGPYISPDGSFLVFESDRAGGLGSTDLYVSFKGKLGDWGRAINMGPLINSTFAERFARLSPDGKYLFFGSSREESEKKAGFDIYWIESSVIDDIKKSRAAEEDIQHELGDKLLDALDLGQWDISEKLLNQWLADYPTDADAILTYGMVLKKQKKIAEAERFLKSQEAIFKDNVDYAMELAVLNMALGRGEIADPILNQLLSAGKDQWNRFMSVSSSLFDLGLFDESDSYFSQAMSISMWNFGYYKRGASYASIGDTKRAFENLHKAIDNGFTNREQFETDIALESLKSDARWKEVMTSLIQ